MAESYLDTFTSSFGRGVDQTQAMGFAFAKTIGDLTGFDALSEWGAEGALEQLRQAAENPPKVATWEDVDSLRDFGHYVVQAVGEFLPQLVPTLGAGGVAGVAGRSALMASPAFKAAVGKAVKNKIGEAAFQEFVKRKAQQTLFTAGVTTAATALNTGETQLQFDERGIDSPGSVLAAGAVKGALDTIGIGRIANAARLAGTDPGTIVNVALEVLKETGTTGTVEGVTEGLQTVVDLVAVKANDPTFDLFDAENLIEIRESMLRGAIAGGVTAGAARSVSGTVDHIVQKDAYRKYRERRVEDVNRIAEEIRQKPDVEFTPVRVEDAPPIPESQATVDAQARALVDPTSAKRALVLTPGTPEPSPGIIPDGEAFVRQVAAAGGGLSTVVILDRALARQFDAIENPTDADVGELLYGRRDGKEGVEDLVIVSRDAEGQPVSEVLTSEETLAEDLANAQAITPEGGTEELGTVTSTIGERIAGLAAEAGDQAANAGQIDALWGRLPVGVQRSVSNLMAQSPENARAAAADLALLARSPQGTQDQAVGALERQIDEDIAREAELLGDRFDRQLTDEEAFEEGLVPPGAQAGETVTRPPRLNREGAGYGSEIAANNALAEFQAQDPSVELEVVPLETGGFAIQETRPPAELAPELTGTLSFREIVGQLNEEGQRVANIATRRDIDERTGVSESGIASRAIEKARRTGKQRESALTVPKGRQRATADVWEQQNPGARERAENSTIRVITPEGETQTLIVPDLAEGGVNLLNARGFDREVTPSQASLLGFAAMLGEMAQRGYDIDTALDADGNIRPELLVRQEGQIRNPNSNAADVRAGDVNQDGMFGQPVRQQPVESEGTPTDTRRETIVEARDDSGNIILDDQGNPVLETGTVPAATQELQGFQEIEAAQFTGLSTQQRTDAEQADTLAGPARAPGPRQFEETRTREQLSRIWENPDVQSENGRVRGWGDLPGQQNLSQSDVDFVDFVFSEIGLTDVNVGVLDARLLDDTTLGEALLGSKFAEVREAFANPDRPRAGAVVKTPRGPVIVVRGFGSARPNADARAVRTMVLGHEAGHIVLDAAIDAMPPAMRQRFEQLFQQEKAANPVAAWNGPDGFREWFADKVAARARTLSQKPQNLMDKYLRDVATRLRKVWNSIKGRIPKRFHSNVSFNEVIDQMKYAEILDSANVLNPAAHGEVDFMHWDPAVVGDQVSRATLHRARQGLRDTLNGVIRTPVIGTVLFTTDGRLRAIDEELANMLYRRSNTSVRNLPWQEGMSYQRRKWLGELNGILRPYIKNGKVIEGKEEVLDGAMRILSQEIPNNQIDAGTEAGALALSLRGFLEAYFDQYLAPNVRGLTKEDNYTPRIHNSFEVQHRKDEFLEILNRHDYEDPIGLYNAIAREPEAFNERTLQTTRERWQKERQIRDPALIADLVEAGFMNTSPLLAITAYIYDSTRRAEYERVFGGERADGTWDSNHKLKVALQRIPEKDRGKALKLVEQTVFPQTSDPNSRWHEFISEVNAYEALRVLTFSAVASIPEMAGVYARTKGGLEDGDMFKIVTDVINDSAEAKQFAEDLGIVRNMIGSSVANEVYVDPRVGNPNASGLERIRPTNLLPLLMEYNGNDMVTNFARIAGAATARVFLMRQVEAIENNTARADEARRFLRELQVVNERGDVDIAPIRRWIDNGMPVWNHAMEGQEAADADLAGRALSIFVDQSVIHPNSSERPSWASHPLFRLAYALKSFAMTYNKNILSGIYREIENRLETGGVSTLVNYVPFLAGAAFVFLGMGAVSDELRQRVLSFGRKGTLESNRHDPGRIVSRWVDRAGFTSMPYWDVLTRPNAESVAYGAGPTAHHLYELMFEYYGPNSEAIKAMKSVPVLSQFPKIRREILDLAA